MSFKPLSVKMKFLIISVYFLLATVVLQAQVENYPAAAQSRSLADATVALNNRWAGFGNPASLAFLKEVSTGIYIENRFNIKELYSGAFTLNVRRFNLNFYSFSNSTLYSRQKFGLAYALALSKTFSAGIELDLIRTHIAEYGNSLGFCGELGLYYIPFKGFSVGAHVFNPGMAGYHGLGNEKIPTSMSLGACYKIDENSFLVFEAENNSRLGFRFKGGMEYTFLNSFALRLGARSNPLATTFGIGFKTAKMSVDIALIYQQQLDSSPGLSFDYIYKKENFPAYNKTVTPLF